MSATDPRSGRAGGTHDAALMLVVAGAAAAALAVVNVGPRVSALAEPGDQQLPGNPVALAAGVVRGDVDWTTSASIASAAFAIALVAVLAVGARAWRRSRARRARVDRGARWMAGKRHYGTLLESQAAEKARSFGVQGTPGLPIGRALRGGGMLYMSFEDVSVDICGPRTGKTTSRAIPVICAAPGAVVATSNKRDLVDATRGVRETDGPVWVFDPQSIVDEQPTWWWNPLTYVTDDVRAEALADVVISSNTDPAAKKDAYFDSAGKQLFKQLLLAAALGGKPITEIYLWLSDPKAAQSAVEILYRHGYPLLAAGLEASLGFSDKQRSGLFGTALNYCSFLTNAQAMRWVTGTHSDRRPHFDPAAFAGGEAKQTLYLVSKEGNGSTGALVTALTMAVCEAAEEQAKKLPRGRLAVPMTVVLDEAANVCRWRELPNLYSHYGSRGVVMLTILQSWSQGVEVWGQSGMNKLWSAANVKVYGGGVAETEFLEQLSKLVGDYELPTTSTTRGSGTRTTQQSTRRDRIFDVADLAALDRGRFLVLSSGNPPVLAIATPWYEPASPYREAVQASLDRYEPGRQPPAPVPVGNPWITSGVPS